MEQVEVHPVGTAAELARLRRMEARVKDEALEATCYVPLYIDDPESREVFDTGAYRAALLKEED